MGFWDFMLFGFTAVVAAIFIVCLVAVWRGTKIALLESGNGKGSQGMIKKINSLMTEMNERQKKMEEDIADLRTRNENIERILREVE